VAVVPAAAAFGAAYIAITGVALLWATRVYPDAVAFGVGASFLAIAVGQALGAPAVGVLLETTSVPTAFTLTAATGACALLVRPGRVTAAAQAAASIPPRRR
jgi:predicted MFS family arabinose efflux permease